MKKLFLSMVVAAFGFGVANAQEGFKAGAHIGVPVGNASDYFGVNFGAEVSYLYPVMDNLHVGGIAGLDLYSGKEITGTGTKLKGLTLLPVGASAQYDFLEQFFAGVDLGYALSLSKDYDGGFFFQPKGGWQNEDFQAFVFIKGVSSGVDVVDPVYSNYSTLTTFGIGGAYKF